MRGRTRVRQAPAGIGRACKQGCRPPFEKLTTSLLGRVFALAVVLAIGGCGGEDALTNSSGKLSGQVIVSGPLRGATVSVDRIDLVTGEVAAHVADAVTNEQDDPSTADLDETGHFSIATDEHDGLFRITARGGEFVDLVTGRKVQLDGASELVSLAWLELFEERNDVLVSPVGHLIEARWRYLIAPTDGSAALDVTTAAKDAAKSLNRHFAGVDWMTVKPADLRVAAASPTEPVRAAFVQAAFSRLARDVADAAQSTEQEVNTFTLVKQWADDLKPPDPLHSGTFDGNDGNKDEFNSGMQLALGCEPYPATCERVGACPTGLCRTMCDQYAGAPRARFAAAMGTVINDNNAAEKPMALNQTTLSPADLLPVARAVNENVDFDLFGRECIEQLDRAPPSLVFLSPTPAEGGYAGGIVEVKVQAFDLLDDSPQTAILGHPDADGDDGNSIARALIDTGNMNGVLKVEAESRDSAGNVVHVERIFTIDNLAPELGLLPGDFIERDSTWWTAAAMPVLQGTVTDNSPVTVTAVVTGSSLLTHGIINGGQWTITLPPDPQLSTSGADVTITATDAAGNQDHIVRRLRIDDKLPELGFQPSTTTDEGSETVMFPISEDPIHSHDGAPVDLTIAATSGACPVVLTKYSYLLGASSPLYVTEQPARNPIAYRLVAADDGIGIVPNSTQYRVRRRESAGPPTLLRDWTSTGAGVVLQGGAHLFDVAITSNLVAELSTREATYDVDFRTSDQLGRTTPPISRCFDLKLKAPPLHFTTGEAARNHAYALDTLSIQSGAPFRQVAERLLNINASGASLIDQRIVNGTTETIYLTVDITKSAVNTMQRFIIRNEEEVTPIPAGSQPTCDPDAENDPCDTTTLPPAGVAPYNSVDVLANPNVDFPVRLFEINSVGSPAVEIPCLAPCPLSGQSFKFAVPPRAGGNAPARQFIIMSMIGQVTSLWPTDSNRPAGPQFHDSSLGIGGITYTGKEHFFDTGCKQRNPNGTKCISRNKVWQYRRLVHVKLQLMSLVASTYRTAPTLQLDPSFIRMVPRQASVWEHTIQ